MPTLYLKDQRRSMSLTATVKKPADSDPLVGLFASSPDLATQSEDILQQEITQKSVWT